MGGGSNMVREDEDGISYWLQDCVPDELTDDDWDRASMEEARKAIIQQAGVGDIGGGVD